MTRGDYYIGVHSCLCGTLLSNFLINQYGLWLILSSVLGMLLARAFNVNRFSMSTASYMYKCECTSKFSQVHVFQVIL